MYISILLGFKIKLTSHVYFYFMRYRTDLIDATQAN